MKKERVDFWTYRAMDEYDKATGPYAKTLDTIVSEAIEKAVNEEREACAKSADHFNTYIGFVIRADRS